MTTPLLTRTGSLRFEIAACDGHFRFNVTFSGTKAAEDAIAFITRKDEQHRREDGLGQIVWALLDDSDQELISDELSEFLWPTCEHGMSLQLCCGPMHYPTYDQERAWGW